MSIRDDLTIDWTTSPRIIEVADPSIALTVQDLYDTLRSLASQDIAIDEDEIVDGSGKEDLGDEVLVGLTVKLLNAQVRFEEKASPTICVVSGGNLVAVDADGNSIHPTAFSANVNIILARSTSASLIVSEGVESGGAWDELSADHSSEGSFGALVNFIGNSMNSGLTAAEIAEAVWNATAAMRISELIDFIADIEGGRWKILDNQMIFYKADNITEIARFNLLGKDGQPTEVDAYERVHA